MPSSPKKRERTLGVEAATAASAAMIAQQVAGKAVRDALFLTSFDVRQLPAMMAAAAVLSLLTVLWLSRILARYTPARVVPLLFGANSVALVGAWSLSFASPAAAAAVVYLLSAVFAPALISSFWSLINERFDPHTARRAVARVAGGGTLGGVVGSVVAWRAADFVTLPTMLLLLAGTSLVCLWGTWTLRASRSAVTPAIDAAPAEPNATSALGAFRDVPYLRTLALLVALGSATSSLLDYVFSAEAAEHVGRGPALLRFFGLFWLGVSLLSFLLQALLGRVAIRKLGLAITVALLPGVVVLGGTFALALPGLMSAALLRGAEAAQRNSLFRSAYEMLYTPLSEDRKRATKTIIDVAFDRAGTVLGSGVVAVALAASAKNASAWLLAVAVAASVALLARSRALHRGYIVALEKGLVKGSVKVALRDVDDAATRRLLRSKAAAPSDVIDPERLVEVLATRDDASPPPRSRRAGRDLDGATGGREDLVRAFRDLASGDTARVRTALGLHDPLEPALVPPAILLLAHGDLGADALKALTAIAPEITGQLVDALLSAKTAFVIRRRIPRALSRCLTQRSADGLLLGLGDARFEVRYECGRALLHVCEGNADVKIATADAIAAVHHEVSVMAGAQPTESELDDDDDERPTLVDRLLRDRVHKSLEHVFTILALHLEREPLRLAFRALHQDDQDLRGTALEYLENVLPDEVRDEVWPFVGEARPMRGARPAAEILADLLRGQAALRT